MITALLTPPRKGHGQWTAEANGQVIRRARPESAIAARLIALGADPNEAFQTRHAHGTIGMIYKRLADAVKPERDEKPEDDDEEGDEAELV